LNGAVPFCTTSVFPGDGSTYPLTPTSGLVKGLKATWTEEGILNIGSAGKAKYAARYGDKKIVQRVAESISSIAT
jgi:hypothetical protein